MVPDVLKIALDDSTGGQAHGLDGPPADLLLAIKGEGNEGPQDAFLAHRHFGDPFELPLVEQFVQRLLER